jgi:hypothetical protein
MTSIPKPIPKQPARLSDTVKGKIPATGNEKKQSSINKMGLVKSIKETLAPFKDEFVSEWRWLMKKLRVYDYEREEKVLDTYRKFRGWK